MDDQIDEILTEFIQETREHLAAIEPDLLELERRGEQASTDVINRIFRAIHSTKGGASFMSFEALKDFSHAMENVLMRMRDGALKPTSNVVDVLLRAVDILKAMVDDIQRSDQIPCERELKALNGLLRPSFAAVPASSNEPQTSMQNSLAVNSEPSSPEPTAGAIDIQSATAAPEVQETLRVRVDLLTRLMNVAGEMVLGRNQLLRLLRDSSDAVPGLGAILQNLDRVTTELHEGVMQTRMQPISLLFSRYTRLVRDLGRQLGKTIDLTTSGKDVELDKSIIEALSDPLTHVIRNSIDHGIENADERILRGKPPGGQIGIAAYHESGQVNIVVTDDGRGVNRAKVLKKALEKGLVTQAEVANFGDADILQLLLMPGFSTAEHVTEVSGRGVGMDVVQANVGRLGGRLELESTEGVGTTIRLRLPLTLAIIPSLVVRVQDARFAVPQANIVELVWIRGADVASRLETIRGAPVMRTRGRLLPLVGIAELLGMAPFNDPAPGSTKTDASPILVAEGNRSRSIDSPITSNEPNDVSVVVLKSGDLRFGVLVDALYEWEEIVVKPLPSFLKDLECFAGTTILGDGRVIMILDPGGIAKVAQLNLSRGEFDEKRQVAAEQVAEESRSVILLYGAPGELYAIPQDRVLRLERFDASELKRIGQQDYVSYRGQGLPVVRLESHYPVSSVPMDADEFFVVIPRLEAAQTSASTCGILVWKILDALDVNVHLSRAMFPGPGIKGAALIDGTLATFIDPAELVSAVIHERGAA